MNFFCIFYLLSFEVIFLVIEDKCYSLFCYLLIFLVYGFFGEWDKSIGFFFMKMFISINLKFVCCVMDGIVKVYLCFLFRGKKFGFKERFYFRVWNVVWGLFRVCVFFFNCKKRFCVL